MFLDFNKEKIHLQVLCGTLETYKPSINVKKIQKMVDKLKCKVEKFRDEKVLPELKEIEELIKEENNKQQFKK